MNLSKVPGKSKQERTRRNVRNASPPTPTSPPTSPSPPTPSPPPPLLPLTRSSPPPSDGTRSSAMVTKNHNGNGGDLRPPKNSLQFSSDRLKGYTILQEMPVVSRLIVRCDLNSRQGTTANNDPPDDIPTPKTAAAASATTTSTTTTTTLYKCHLCRCVCPTLHRMRCHLIFHCRKDSLQCFSFQVKSNDRNSDQEAPEETRQDCHDEVQSVCLESYDGCHGDSRHLAADDSNDVAENLSLNKKQTSRSDLEEEDWQNGGPSPDACAGRMEGEDCAAPGGKNGEKSRGERMKGAPGKDSRISAECFDSASSRKRSFSTDDDLPARNSIIAQSRDDDDDDDDDGKNERKKFSRERSCIVHPNFEQKQERHFLSGDVPELWNGSNFRSFDRDGFERANFRPSMGSPAPLNGYDPLTPDRCLLQQNGPPFISPYYWLARQHWFGLGMYPEIPRQEERDRTPKGALQNCPPRKSSPPTMHDDAKECDVNPAVKQVPAPPPPAPPPPQPPGLFSTPHGSSPAGSPPTSSPSSKSSSPSVDSTCPSSPLAPSAGTAFQLYNPLEIVQIMRNLTTAYPNFLPPVYPALFSMPQNLQGQSLQTDPTYKPEADENVQTLPYPAAMTAPPSQTQVSSSSSSSAASSSSSSSSSFSLDKSLGKGLPYYPFLNFSPPSSCYNPPRTKFVPAQNQHDASASSVRLSAFNHHGRYYENAFSSESSYRIAAGKTWPSPLGVASPPDPSVRRDIKHPVFCKADKSEAMKSSAKRGEACRPIKLADGRTVYHCSQCRKTFTNISDVNRHMDFHEDVRPFKCKFCSYYARTNSQLKVHMMRHQGIRQYVCHLCNYKGVTQSDLNRHTKSQIHVLKSRNECSQCSEGFVSPMNLAQHCKDRHHSSVT